MSVPEGEISRIFQSLYDADTQREAEQQQQPAPETPVLDVQAPAAPPPVLPTPALPPLGALQPDIAPPPTAATPQVAPGDVPLLGGLASAISPNDPTRAPIIGGIVKAISDITKPTETPKLFDLLDTEGGIANKTLENVQNASDPLGLGIAAGQGLIEGGVSALGAVTGAIRDLPVAGGLYRSVVEAPLNVAGEAALAAAGLSAFLGQELGYGVKSALATTEFGQQHGFTDTNQLQNYYDQFTQASQVAAHGNPMAITDYSAGAFSLLTPAQQAVALFANPVNAVDIFPIGAFQEGRALATATQDLSKAPKFMKILYRLPDVKANELLEPARVGLRPSTLAERLIPTSLSTNARGFDMLGDAFDRVGNIMPDMPPDGFGTFLGDMARQAKQGTLEESFLQKYPYMNSQDSHLAIQATGQFDAAKTFEAAKANRAAAEAVLESGDLSKLKQPYREAVESLRKNKTLDAARTLDHVQKIDMLGEWGKHVGGTIRNTLGIKDPGTIQKMLNSMKAWEGALYIGLNPGSWARNWTSNWGRMLTEGIMPWDDTKKIEATFKALGWNPLDEVHEIARTGLTNEPKPGMFGAQMPKKIRHLLPFNDRIEQAARKKAFWSGFQDFLKHNHVRGRSFNYMPKDLEDTLAQLNPRLPNLVYGAIEHGYSREAIADAVNSVFTHAKVQQFVELPAFQQELARVLGLANLDADTTRTFLARHMDELNAAITRARSRKDVPYEQAIDEELGAFLQRATDHTQAGHAEEVIQRQAARTAKQAQESNVVTGNPYSHLSNQQIEDHIRELLLSNDKTSKAEVIDRNSLEIENLFNEAQRRKSAPTEAKPFSWQNKPPEPATPPVREVPPTPPTQATTGREAIMRRIKELTDQPHSAENTQELERLFKELEQQGAAPPPVSNPLSWKNPPEAPAAPVAEPKSPTQPPGAPSAEVTPIPDLLKGREPYASQWDTMTPEQKNLAIKQAEVMQNETNPFNPSDTYQGKGDVPTPMADVTGTKPVPPDVLDVLKQAMVDGLTAVRDTTELRKSGTLTETHLLRALNKEAYQVRENAPNFKNMADLKGREQEALDILAKRRAIKAATPPEPPPETAAEIKARLAEERTATMQKLREAKKLANELEKEGRKDMPETLPRDKYPPETSQNVAYAAGQMKDELLSGQPGARTFDYTSGPGITVGKYGSSYPQWYGDLVEKYGAKRETVINALDKIVKDKGKDQGLTVERIKAIILEDIANGLDTPGGKLPPDWAAMQMLGRPEKEVSKAYDAWVERLNAEAVPENPQVGTTSETPIPTIKMTSMGETDIELPVALAVENTLSENSVSSGWHSGFSQEFNGMPPRWAIVYDGKVSSKLKKAAESNGLEVKIRKTTSGKTSTDVSLPETIAGRNDIDKAKQIFNQFANEYESGTHAPAVATPPIGGKNTVRESLTPARTSVKSTKEPWQMTQSEYLAQDISLQSVPHSKIIEAALKSDVFIPSEVLAEYPDLAKKYGKFVPPLSSAPENPQVGTAAEAAFGQAPTEPPQGQADMFKQGAQENQDLPLFSGTPQTAEPAAFNPPEQQGTQEKMFPTAPEFGAKKPRKGFNAVDDATRRFDEFKQQVPPMPHEMGPNAVDASMSETEFLSKAIPVLRNHLLEQAKLAPKALDPLTARALRDYLEKDVYPTLTDLRSGATAIGRHRVQMTVLDYDRQTNANQVLSYAFPFWYWRTENMKRWIQTFLEKPALYLGWQKAQEAMDQSTSDPRFPKRLKGKMRLPAPPFLEDWMGGSIYLKPLEQVMPIEQLYTPELQRAQFGARGLLGFPPSDSDIAKVLRDKAIHGEFSRSEVENAIANKKGDLWEQATQEAQQANVSSDNLTDLFTPHAPLQWLVAALTHQTNSIGPLLPISRPIRSITGAAGMNGGSGVNIESPVRNILKSLGLSDLPEFDPFEEYRVDRMLANMVDDGEIDEKQAKLAMLQKSGASWNEASRRASAEAKGNPALALINLATPVSVYPEGEQGITNAQFELRALKAQEVSRLGGDPNNMTYDEREALLKAKGAYEQQQLIPQFYDAHPELDARSAVFQQPEERLKKWMIDALWEKYNNASALDKRLIKSQLGADFASTFIQKPTRDYDKLDILQLVRWGQQLDAVVPNIPKGEIESADVARMLPVDKIQWADQSQSDAYQQFKDKIDQTMPNINTLLDEYSGLKTTAEKKEYSRRHPEIAAYYKARDAFYAQNPDIEQLLSDTGAIKSQPTSNLTQGQVFSIAVERAGLDWDSITKEKEEYYALAKGTGERSAYLGEHPDLLRYFKLAGAYYGTNDEQISAAKPYIRFHDPNVYSKSYGHAYTPHLYVDDLGTIFAQLAALHAQQQQQQPKRKTDYKTSTIVA